MSALGLQTRHVLMTRGRHVHDRNSLVTVRTPVNECMHIADRMARADRQTRIYSTTQHRQRDKQTDGRTEITCKSTSFITGETRARIT